jgi:hypothetical protein
MFIFFILFLGNIFAQEVNFPKAIYLRTPTKSYNEKYNFIILKNKVWVSRRGGDSVAGNWQELPFHEELKNPKELSADSDHLIVIDGQGRIFSTRKALEDDPLKIKGTKRWGPPLWLGPGMHMPPNYKSWSISFLSPREDKYWVDPAGNKQSVGQGVSSIYVLDQGGQSIIYLDPWLPIDYSYQMCTPVNGRFQAESISSSGSTHLIINRFGDMYTQTYDFDISGADNLFFRYTYDPSRGKAPKKPNLLSGFVSVRVIPTEGWKKQPKIPGTITDKISIYRKGEGVINHLLRVEGQNGGVNGFWERETRGNDPWRFIPTGLPLEGRILANSSNDQTMDSLGLDMSHSFSLVQKDGTILELPNFNPHCSTSDLIAKFPSGETLKLKLHTHQKIRFLKRQAGLTTKDLPMAGAIEIPPKTQNLSIAAQDFLKSKFKNQRFSEVSINANLWGLEMKLKGNSKWKFKRGK